MEKRQLGRHDVYVTPIGFGAAQIGYLNLAVDEAAVVLNGVLDSGINVIDTAACYPNSEELIGATIAKRRDEYVLVTKCGHKTEESDPPEWSPEIIRHSAERSLRRLRTDHLDLLLLHSCDVDVLENDRVIEELVRCKRDGLTRLIGYSGENEAAEKAVAMGVFDCLETSISIADQQVLERWLLATYRAGMGVFAKRPVANTAWRDLSNYSEMYVNYSATYRERIRAMGLSPASVGFDGEWIEMALRFTAWQPGVSSILVGSRTPGHLEENARLIAKGPLPEAVVQAIRETWKRCDDGTWVGQV